MNIRAVDIKDLSESLEGELQAGNQWTVYEAGYLHARFDNAVHFQNREDATQYITDNTADVYDFDLVATRPLYNAIRELPIADIQRNDIAYYEIDKTSFGISRVLYSNPDQNPLHNPDGNYFTDELIMHVEKKEKHRTSQELLMNWEKFDRIRIQLNSQGYDPDFFVTLAASMLNGASKHEECFYDQFDGDTIMYNHLFNKNSDGSYSLDNISGTLYSFQDIDHLTINGIDTRELEMEMSQVSCYVSGYRFIIPHEDILRQLSEDPNGRLIAVKLYNNYVPHWLDKPEFVSHLEDELRIYPKMDFPGETKASDIYLSLDSYRKISTILRQFSIAEAQDAKSMAALIEKLVKGESCYLIAPQGQRQGDEVVLEWDNYFKGLSFVFKDAPELDARQYFEKKSSTQLESRQKEGHGLRKENVEPDNKLISKLRNNKDKGMSL